MGFSYQSVQRLLKIAGQCIMLNIETNEANTTLTNKEKTNKDKRNLRGYNDT